MAVLSDTARAEITVQFMEQMAGPCGCLEPDVRAAVNAVDDWYNTNASNANQALPPAARTGLTTPDKGLMSQMVVEKRWRSGV